MYWALVSVFRACCRAFGYIVQYPKQRELSASSFTLTLLLLKQSKPSTTSMDSVLFHTSNLNGPQPHTTPGRNDSPTQAFFRGKNFISFYELGLFQGKGMLKEQIFSAIFGFLCVRLFLGKLWSKMSESKHVPLCVCVHKSACTLQFFRTLYSLTSLIVRRGDEEGG